MKEIDLVIPWVDGSDPVWLEERSKYLKNKSINSGYYQDWGWMRYWFRCVEKNMPWIRYVFFVTYGHTPKWLNMKHPKLKIVNHKDYMLPEFLPTYNSDSISLNIHRIDELSETFIYAEDDTFFIGKQSPEDFFSDEGLPKDCLWFCPITEHKPGDFIHILLNNNNLINSYFDIQKITEERKELLLSGEYPAAVCYDNNKYSGLKYIPGFKETHLPYALCKSSFDEVWKAATMAMYKTSMFKFRTVNDLNICAVRDWQLASGHFTPSFKKGNHYTDTANPSLYDLITCKDTNMLCINETDNQKYTAERAEEICSYFEERFPEKSSFELN